MKKLLLPILLAVLLSGLIFSGCSASPTSTPGTATASAPATVSNSGAITLNAINFQTGDATKAYYEEQFINYVNAHSAGKLFINYRGGTEVMPVKNQVQALINDTIDMTVIPSTYYVSVVPEADVLPVSPLNNLGMQSPQAEEQSGLTQWEREAHAQKGLYYLGRGSLYQPAMLFSNVKISSVTDIKGLKVAVPGQSYVNYIEALGASALSIAGPDRYSGMQLGTVDAVATSPNTAVPDKTYEVSKYLVMPAFKTNTGVVFLFSLKAWQSLPQNLQQMLQDAMDWCYYYMRDYDYGIQATSESIILANGVQRIDLPASEVKNYQETFDNQIWAELKSNLSPDQYQKALDLTKATKP